MSTYFPFLLPLFSVLIGYAFALFIKPKAKKNLKLLLAFSGSFLLSLTVMHLLPELYVSNNSRIGLFIMLGILFQIVLEFFSKGAEHGHVHGHDKLQKMPKKKNNCGRPGVNGGYIDNPYIKFGVNCYGKKPKPSDHDLNRMKANEVPELPPSKEEKEKQDKIQKWKDNADEMLRVNAYNKKRWSKY